MSGMSPLLKSHVWILHKKKRINQKAWWVVNRELLSHCHIKMRVTHLWVKAMLLGVWCMKWYSRNGGRLKIRICSSDLTVSGKITYLALVLPKCSPPHPLVPILHEVCLAGTSQDQSP